MSCSECRWGEEDGVGMAASGGGVTGDDDGNGGGGWGVEYGGMTNPTG